MMGGETRIADSGQIGRLVVKDFYLNRIPVGWILFASVVGVVLTLLPGSGSAIGITLILNVFIAMIFYLPLSSVLGEVSEKTLPFVMSLPVSAVDYTVAKILSNLLLYLIPWTAIAIGAAVALGRTPELASQLPGGLVAIVLGSILFLFSTVLAVSIVTRSTGWTVGLIVALLFVYGNLLTLIIPSIPVVAKFTNSAVNGGVELYVVLASQLLLILGVLGSAVLHQSSARNFV